MAQNADNLALEGQGVDINGNSDISSENGILMSPGCLQQLPENKLIKVKKEPDDCPTPAPVVPVKLELNRSTDCLQTEPATADSGSNGPIPETSLQGANTSSATHQGQKERAPHQAATFHPQPLPSGGYNMASFPVNPQFYPPMGFAGPMANPYLFGFPGFPAQSQIQLPQVVNGMSGLGGGFSNSRLPGHRNSLADFYGHILTNGIWQPGMHPIQGQQMMMNSTRGYPNVPPMMPMNATNNMFPFPMGFPNLRFPNTTMRPPMQTSKGTQMSNLGAESGGGEALLVDLTKESDPQTSKHSEEVVSGGGSNSGQSKNKGDKLGQPYPVGISSTAKPSPMCPQAGQITNPVGGSNISQPLHMGRNILPPPPYPQRPANATRPAGLHPTQGGQVNNFVGGDSSKHDIPPPYRMGFPGSFMQPQQLPALTRHRTSHSRDSSRDQAFPEPSRHQGAAIVGSPVQPHTPSASYLGQRGTSKEKHSKVSEEAFQIWRPEKRSRGKHGKDQRRSRHLFTPYQLKVLNECFSQSRYLVPARHDYHKLATLTGLRHDQLRTWFERKRKSTKMVPDERRMVSRTSDQEANMGTDGQCENTVEEEIAVITHDPVEEGRATSTEDLFIDEITVNGETINGSSPDVNTQNGDFSDVYIPRGGQPHLYVRRANSEEGELTDGDSVAEDGFITDDDDDDYLTITGDLGSLMGAEEIPDATHHDDHASTSVAIVTPEKLHQCHYCEKSFLQQIGLRIHQHVHKRKRPIECDTCGEEFERLPHLRKHKRLKRRGRHTKGPPSGKSKKKLHKRKPINSEREHNAVKKTTKRKPVNKKLHKRKPINIERERKGCSRHNANTTTTKRKPLKRKLPRPGPVSKKPMITRPAHRNPVSKKPMITRSSQIKPVSKKRITRQSARIKKDSRSYKCNICGITFSKIGALVSHSRRHSIVRHYICNLCGHFFKRNVSLITHVREKHANKELFQGDLESIAQAASDPGDIDDGNESNDPATVDRDPEEKGTYKCNYCEREFEVTGMRVHLSYHRKNPAKCDVCWKQFDHLYDLKEHKRRIRQGVSSRCSVSLRPPVTKPRKIRLSEPESLNTIDRSYKCTTCGEIFDRIFALLRHEKLHNVPGHYPCDICGKVFKLNIALINHKKTHGAEEAASEDPASFVKGEVYSTISPVESNCNPTPDDDYVTNTQTVEPIDDNSLAKADKPESITHAENGGSIPSTKGMPVTASDNSKRTVPTVDGDIEPFKIPEDGESMTEAESLVRISEAKDLQSICQTRPSTVHNDNEMTAETVDPGHIKTLSSKAERGESIKNAEDPACIPVEDTKPDAKYDDNKLAAQTLDPGDIEHLSTAEKPDSIADPASTSLMDSKPDASYNGDKMLAPTPDLQSNINAKNLDCTAHKRSKPSDMQDFKSADEIVGPGDLESVAMAGAVVSSMSSERNSDVIQDNDKSAKTVDRTDPQSFTNREHHEVQAPVVDTPGDSHGYVEPTGLVVFGSVEPDESMSGVRHDDNESASDLVPAKTKPDAANLYHELTAQTGDTGDSHPKTEKYEPITKIKAVGAVVPAESMTGDRSLHNESTDEALDFGDFESIRIAKDAKSTMLANNNSEVGNEETESTAETSDVGDLDMISNDEHLESITGHEVAEFIAQVECNTSVNGDKCSGQAFDPVEIDSITNVEDLQSTTKAKDSGSDESKPVASHSDKRLESQALDPEVFVEPNDLQSNIHAQSKHSALMDDKSAAQMVLPVDLEPILEVAELDSSRKDNGCDVVRISSAVRQIQCDIQVESTSNAKNCVSVAFDESRPGTAQCEHKLVAQRVTPVVSIAKVVDTESNTNVVDLHPTKNAKGCVSFSPSDFRSCLTQDGCKRTDQPADPVCHKSVTKRIAEQEAVVMAKDLESIQQVGSKSRDVSDGEKFFTKTANPSDSILQGGSNDNAKDDREILSAQTSTSVEREEIKSIGEFEHIRNVQVSGSILQEKGIPCVKNNDGEVTAEVVSNVPKLYSCDYCEKMFESQLGVTMHKRCHRKGRLKCDTCGSRFTSREGLRKHKLMQKKDEHNRCFMYKAAPNGKRRKVEVMPSKCDICGGKFRHKSAVTLHQLKMHKTFPCDICGAVFTLESFQNKHMEVHTDGELYRCHVCQRSFTRSRSLKSHLATHTVESLHFCDVCGEAFKTKLDLIDHKRSELHGEVTKTELDKLEKRCRRKKQARKRSRSQMESNNAFPEMESDNDLPEMENESNLSERSKSQGLSRQGLVRDTSYKCRVCKETLKGADSLKDHLKIHIKETNNLCGICGRAFNEKGILTAHIKTHVKPYQCDDCGMSFSRHSILMNHKVVHSGKKPFKCDVCNRAFKRLDDVRRHKVVHIVEKPYHCRICGKAFKRKRELVHHGRVHSEQRPYPCGACGDSFKRLKDLKKHQKKHDAERYLQSEVCENSASGKHKFDQEKGADAKDNTCTLCGRSFPQTDSSPTAQIFEEESFLCDFCGKSFASKYYLGVHRKTHTKERPHKCDICQKSFARRCTLRIHQSVHSEDTPYCCEVCGKAFKTRQALRLHRVVHSQETPYKCDVCDSAFKRKVSLARHRKVHT